MPGIHIDVKMEIQQYVAVLNTENESLEISIWLDINKIMPKKTGAELMLLVELLFYEFTFGDKGYQNIMVAYGSNERVINIIPEDHNKYLNKIKYVLFEGKCLDEKKLSYFLPRKILKSGTLSKKDIKNLKTDFNPSSL